jgi:aminoglycoside phosphotransferase (APT) family kinase protein
VGSDADFSGANALGRAVRDPALPTLADAFDAEAIARGFEAAWSDVQRESPAPTVIGGRADTAYAPGSSCVVTYPVALQSREDEPQRTAFGVVEVDAAGTRFRRFVDDPAMPGLVVAADAAVVSNRLSAAVGNGEWRPVPIRYKPGRSCVLRYAAVSREPVYGKVFARDAERHAEVLAGLDEAGAADPQMPRIAAPVAVLPELCMIVQPEVSGRSLSEAANDPSPSIRAMCLRAAGTALAALHATTMPARRTVRWQDDVSELAGYLPLFLALAPEIAPSSHEVVRRLQEATRTVSNVRLVPSHGACRTDQFVLRDDGAIVALDLDTYCYADPARDLANILGYLEWHGIRNSPDAAAAVSLIEGYESMAPLPAADRMELYRAVTVLRIAGRRLRRLAFHEWQHLPALVARACDALSL